MGLRGGHGWKANEIHESIWIEDEALADVPPGARAAWKEDGEARHLEPYVRNGKPARIEWRTLNGDELRFVRGFAFDSPSFIVAIERMWRLAFRLAVTIEGMPATIRGKDDVDHPTSKRESTFVMMSSEYCDHIDRNNPGIVDFYGQMIADASQLTEKQKKASSPPSTPTPSSAEEGTAATTEPSPNGAGA
jgi:hypothetical protein